MTPDDPRHGTPAGYRAHQVADQKPCGPCRTAMIRYQKARRVAMQRGDTFTVPSLGYRRRVQALACLGWRRVDVAEAAGLTYGTLREITTRHPERIHLTTAKALDKAYAALSMSHGPSSRTALYAARVGWRPPLAWDDIDDPTERPKR